MASRDTARAEIDAVLHRERLDGRNKRLHALPMPLEKLPDGAMVRSGRRELSDRAGQGAAMVARRLSRSAERRSDDAMLLTPPSTLRAFAAGYRPVLHPSANEV